MGGAQVAVTKAVPFYKGFVLGEVHVTGEGAFEALALEFVWYRLIGEI